MKRTFPIRFTGEREWEPVRGYAGDAGFDLFCSETTHIPYGEFRDVPCGINIELPEGVWAMITGRSSTLRRRQLLVIQGIIDVGYRGPLYAGTQSFAPGPVTVERGERIAQLIPMPLWADKLYFERVSELEPSDRGTNGFGSSGD